MEKVITDPVFEGFLDYLPNSRVLKGGKIMLNEQETKLLIFARSQPVGSHKWFVLQTILDAHAEIRMSLWNLFVPLTESLYENLLNGEA